jgi:hypothetical protein
LYAAAESEGAREGGEIDVEEETNAACESTATTTKSPASCMSRFLDSSFSLSDFIFKLLVFRLNFSLTSNMACDCLDSVQSTDANTLPPV